MAIPENIIDQIQNKTDIVEVISSHIQLKKTGRNYKANCPFHHEKTPSFVVSPDKQIYHCFGCGAGGNVFSFLMKVENLQFPEAVEILAQKAGISLPRDSAYRQETSSLANQLYRINDAACRFFQAHLANNGAVKEYLQSRGIGDEAIAAFKIGYAPNSWDSLLSYFKKKGVDGQTVEKAGLAVANDKGGHYDRFRNRITFPIIDLKDKVLGFGARVLDASLPKYINSPETPIYSKGRNLYGLNVSKAHIRQEGYCLVVEGYMDFIVPYQAGVKNIIATLGTALTADQIKLLKRFTNTVIMVYDPDAAGEAASLRNLDLFVSEDVNVYIAELQEGLDPDAYIRKFGTEEFLKLIKSSKNLFDYKFHKLCQRYNKSTTNGKTSIVNDMLPTISRIDNAVLKSELVKKLAEKLSVDEDSIKTELKKIKAPRIEKRQAPGGAEIKKDTGSAGLMILAIILTENRFIERVVRTMALEEFKDTSIRDVIGAIFELHKENKEANPAHLMNRLGNSQIASALISEAVNMAEEVDDHDKALADCIAKIRKDNIKDRLRMIQDAIKVAHSSKDESKVRQLVSEYNELVKTPKSE